MTSRWLQWNHDITNFYITTSSVKRTILFTPVIVQYIARNLDKTKPLYSEQVLSVPWHWLRYIEVPLCMDRFSHVVSSYANGSFYLRKEFLKSPHDLSLHRPFYCVVHQYGRHDVLWKWWPRDWKHSILYFPIAHNTLCLPPKFCINHCF